MDTIKFVYLSEQHAHLVNRYQELEYRFVQHAHLVNRYQELVYRFEQLAHLVNQCQELEDLLVQYDLPLFTQYTYSRYAHLACQ